VLSTEWDVPHSRFRAHSVLGTQYSVLRVVLGLAHAPGLCVPAVIFFGESVPREKVAYSMARLDQADALLVAGSSLTVWSGFRFVKRAAERGTPVAIVNIGPTRGDALATIKIESKCGMALPELVAGLRDTQADCHPSC
jgi:NAD-dependent SIR2 family protein deacetylase